MTSQIDFDLILPNNLQQPTLVFIHGGGGDKTQWHFQRDFFQARGFGVLTFSLSSHGKSFHSSNNSILDYVKEVSSLISQLELINYVLIGHSMGGGVVLSYGLSISSNPPAGIILIGTGAKLNVAPVFFDLLSSDFDQALRLMGKYSYATATGVEIKVINQNILSKNGPDILIKDLKACQQFDVRDKLGEIEIPSLIICGEEDEMTPVKYSEFLHKKISKSQLVTIPNAGHFVFQEAPDEINEAILKFLIEGMS
ncbi:MAG: alpha/beta hydrolase [Candidatus Heimdallarchaeota archaeon]|nr:alpha/beta hydrolase [Candidatus Heimdallarchaeota archaeon]